MVICVVLCILHGLVFLPAFLILFDSFVQSIRQLSAKARQKINVHDSEVSSRMGSEAPAACKTAVNKRQGFANTRAKNRTDSDDIESSDIHQHLSRISSKTENSVSSITDRPELHFAPEEPSKNDIKQKECQNESLAVSEEKVKNNGVTNSESKTEKAGQ